jgi:NitT/TauT family transport system substrate-binding protein
MRKLLALVLPLLTVVAACGASGGSPASSTTSSSSSCGTPVHFTVRLNYVLDDEQVPYFYALDKGWYRQACLDPEFQASTGSTSTVQLVGNGSADMGVADTVAVLNGLAQGIDLQAFGVVYQHNPTALLIRKSVLTPEQQAETKPSKDILYGKTYGAVISGSPFIFYKAFVKEQNLDASRIRQVNISPPGFTEMATGKVDFIATFYQVAPVLEGLGVPLKIFKLEDYGQKAYGLSYFSTPKWIASHGEVIKKFLAVTKRAIDYTNQHPDEGVRTLCTYNQSICANDTSFKTNVEEFKLYMPLYPNLTPGKPMFCINSTTWKATARLLLDAGVVSSLPDLSNSFTNRFISGC